MRFIRYVWGALLYLVSWFCKYITDAIKQGSKYKIFLVLIAISIFLATMSTMSVVIMADSLANKKIIKDYKPDQTTQIFDINNKLIANIHGDEDRVLVPLSKISTNLRYAVISIEDNRFYEHKGIDFVGTARATFSNLIGNDASIQGGSTLTQQLVKNSFLSPKRTIKRKLIEAILSVRVEYLFSKDKILEMYLNTIYWGNHSYGAEKAAKRYFKKSAKDLDLAEASLLAGLIKAPEGYSPYTKFGLAKMRQKNVLERMEHYGYITKKQRFQAENEKINLASPRFTNSKYAYFVDYVSYLLRKSYGDDVVRRSGLKVYTTLDPVVQQLAEKTIADGIKAIPKSSQVKQGALVSINVKNGYIQALVGGVDFNKSNYNRAVFSKRPAGSSFKPVVYLTGFRKGIITPDSPIVDAPISFNTGWNVWRPHNWDGKYMGKMTIRKALTLSRNTPTVRISLKVGLDSIIQTARLVGIKSSIRRDLSIVLGSLGISPVEMATAYSTFARNGVYLEPTSIRTVMDGEGNVLEEHNPAPVQVVSANFVKQLNLILVDVVNKGTAKAAKLDDRQVAGKTGTTDNVKDIWFTGFTPDTVTTIWLGNDENTKLKGVFSSNCAELWGKFSKEFYKIKKIPATSFLNNPKDQIAQIKLLQKIENEKKKALIAKEKAKLEKEKTELAKKCNKLAEQDLKKGENVDNENEKVKTVLKNKNLTGKPVEKREADSSKVAKLQNIEKSQNKTINASSQSTKNIRTDKINLPLESRPAEEPSPKADTGPELRPKKEINQEEIIYEEQ